MVLRSVLMLIARPSTALGYPFRCVATSLAPASGDHDLGAGIEKALRDRRADAARASSNEGTATDELLREIELTGHDVAFFENESSAKIADMSNASDRQASQNLCAIKWAAPDVPEEPKAAFFLVRVGMDFRDHHPLWHHPTLGGPYGLNSLTLCEWHLPSVWAWRWRRSPVRHTRICIG
jgi:hypothetical protein